MDHSIEYGKPVRVCEQEKQPRDESTAENTAGPSDDSNSDVNLDDNEIVLRLCDDDSHEDNNTSRAGNTNHSMLTRRIRDNSQRSSSNNSNNNSNDDYSNGNSSSSNNKATSSMFEISCSPLPSNQTHRGSSFGYGETRQRSFAEQQQSDSVSGSFVEGKIIPLHPPSSSITNRADYSSDHVPPASNHHVTKQILQQWGRSSNDRSRKRGLPLPEDDGGSISPTLPTHRHGEGSTEDHGRENERETNHANHNYNAQDTDDDDADSCCTLADSDLYYGSSAYDNTGATSKIAEATCHSNIDSNNSNIDSTVSPATETHSGSISNSDYTETTVANSICSSVSRGEEHISSRLRKYGLYNLHEMKRRQQQRRVNRNFKTPMSNGSSTTSSSNNNNTDIHYQSSNSTLQGSSSHPQGPAAVSILSGLTNEGNSMIDDNEESRGQHQSKAQGNSNDNNNNIKNTGAGIPTRIRTAPLHVQMAVEEIHRWLFTEGGHFEDVQTLMTQYSLYVREHFGIPLDRLYYGGVGLHPKLTAYLWKWEPHGEFTHSEMPPEVFARRNELFSPDEPFCVLEQGRADYVRIRDTDSYIPPDTAKWFRAGKFKDYFALPDIHRGVSKGGLAWSTKCPDGFCDDDIQFFRMTHPALTTIMRLHTNDMVLKTLTDRMESEITERTNQLAAANIKLEEANEEISMHASKQLEHFACMSHEIRTPLNCIVGLSSLLLESDDLNDELLETINMVYSSADLVQGVVNDVLDYAKIESGHFELDIHESDLQSTLNGVVHSIANKLRSQDKNVEVRTSYSGRLGKTMTTDSRRLQQILYNILGNAAKFSMEGTTIDFSAKLLEPTKTKVDCPKVGNDDNNEDEAKDNDNIPTENKPPKHTIRFSIKDYGKGIEEKDFEKIFQPFSQASKETQTVYGGTGLGLSITKKLVTRLGGTIKIRSEIGRFTEFIVDLPYVDEPVDVSLLRDKLSETSIVLLDPMDGGAGERENEESDDSFLPFPAEMVEDYGLNVLRCSSWGELESKLGLKANIRENYIFLAHEDIEEQQGFLNTEKIVGRNRCSWFSFGSESSLNHRQRHFKTLTGIFPAFLLERLVEVTSSESIGFQEDHSLNASFSTFNQSIGELSIEDMSESQESDDGKVLPKATGLFAIATSENCSASPVDSRLIHGKPPGTNDSSPSATESSSTKSRKAFATKYPPRDLKVLVVDDNKINQKILERILKRLGVNDISIVNNGKKAVDLTETTVFDCIFMDMEMPVMGGLEASKIITQRDKESARVVFVTAHDIEDIKERADKAGAFGYISKPLKMQEIHTFLGTIEGLGTIHSAKTAKKEFSNRLVKTKSSGDELRKKRSTPPKKKRCTKQYPERELKVLMAEDNLVNQKVLDRILKRVGVKDVTIVDNGKKAVDISSTIKFDCILMDMQMPIMGGLEACKIIVERDKDQVDCPKIVFVTAHALVEFKEKALAAGGFDFIAKPFKMEDIDKMMKTVEDAIGSNTQDTNTAPMEENT
ncbi:unnamed protein product [Pseudo-nitzschia multistriata]|uniref:Histidine kinase n=1 Tax=Pseudo-nitzschia multistriata TaxID=183589 RepID=A0A448ZR60_9STRA|nr:unnamed protein product [Pseudo-nitzschia multistriata]